MPPFRELKGAGCKKLTMEQWVMDNEEGTTKRLRDYEISDFQIGG